MNPVTFVRALPQPLKTFYVLFFLSLVGNFVAVFAHVGGERGIIPLGACAVLIGLTLVTNLRRGADALSQQLRDRRPMGVDYSRSVLASTAFIRLFGVFFTIVGGLMAHLGAARP